MPKSDVLRAVKTEDGQGSIFARFHNGVQFKSIGDSIGSGYSTPSTSVKSHKAISSYVSAGDTGNEVSPILKGQTARSPTLSAST